jgi:interferon gamma-inducible protein 30
MHLNMSRSIALASACIVLLVGSTDTLSTRSQVISSQTAQKKVAVQFIGESLCPDCAAFTDNVLEPVFAAGLDQLIDLDYVGWGNAKNSSGKVACQHGPRECELNRALNCAQRLAASQAAFFKFLFCLERTAFSTSSDGVLRSCSGDAAVDVHALRECTYGSLGAAAACMHGHGYWCIAMHSTPDMSVYTQVISWSGRQRWPHLSTAMCHGSWSMACPWVRPCFVNSLGRPTQGTAQRI